MSRKIKYTVAIFLLMAGVLAISMPRSVYAETVYCWNAATGSDQPFMQVAPDGDCGEGGTRVVCNNGTPEQHSTLTDMYLCQDGERPSRVTADGSTTTGDDKIDKVLVQTVNVLTVVAGLAITGSIVVGGMQYMTAGGNASQVSAAKNRIVVSVASMILLAFGFVLLQWLVPGGIFQ